MLRVGINFPWVTCGHDFGPRPPAWAGAPPTDFDAVADELAALGADGVRTARWWVLAGGVNLPVGTEASAVARRERWLEAWPAAERGAVARRARAPERWVLERPLPRLPDAFLDDFARLLQACRAAGVTLWPSLLSFELLLPLEDQVGGVTSGGRGAFALPPRHGAFFDAVLEPLLDVAEAHRDALEVFEIANEPGWALAPGWLRARFGAHPPWATPEALAELLVEGCRRVARRGLIASVGFLHAHPPWLPRQSAAALRALAERGAYRQQVHHYPSVTGVRRLPDASMALCRPCWVGEVPSSRAGEWPELAPEGERYLEARLALCEARGYEGALLWAHRATDPHVGGLEARAQLRRFSREGAA